MKRLLKQLLSPTQYRSLSRVKKQALLSIKYALVKSPVILVGQIIKLFPDSSLVTLKSKINVVKEMDYDRKAIFLSVESEFEYRIRLNSCKKEPDTIEWIENFIKSGDVIYDVGANCGAYSLVASKFFDGKVKVYAFEPAYLNFNQLCKNLVINDLLESVVPLPVALSDTTSIATFNLQNLVPGGAIHALGEPIDNEGNEFTPAAQQAVLSYRADDLISQFKLEKPHHIKIDVDGAELSILNGMEETFNGTSIRSVLIELNVAQGQNQKILEYMTQKGLKLHSKCGLNLLFVRDMIGSVPRIQ